ncbi:outer membrane beta-barrel protein [Flavobacteriaceae bacterium F08102]|nr:outer membrane beta-barrel protein [Flavobacteriaceae bacterium F08102]
MKNLLYCFFLFSTYMLSAQKKYTSFEIKGRLVAKSDQSPIESATVFVQRVKDSSLVSYTISDKKGAFVLEGKIADEQLRLVISYVGTQSYSKIIDLEAQPIDLKTIVIDDETNVLDEVVLLADTPVRIKKDTIEFTLDFFKTRKDASVEDALKLLPGVEIDMEGNITINGKPVSEVLVNGKPFFGNDPTIATRNLTKEIIDKVQIVDTKTKSEAFTGDEGDLTSKSINLTIKKDENKGAFGHVRAGGGTDARYELSGMINYFNEDLQLGVLGGRNNINRSGFNSGSIIFPPGSLFGGGGAVMSVSSVSYGSGGFGGGGISTDTNGGFNFGNDYGKNTEVSANYFYANTSTENSSKTSRENTLPDRNYFTNSTSSSIRDYDSHRVNASVQFKIDSTWLFNYRPNISYKSSRSSSEQSSNALDDAQVLTNESTTNSFSNGNDKSFSNGLSLTKKFGSKGAYVRVNWNNTITKSAQETYSKSLSEIYGDDPQTISRDQFLVEDRTSNHHTISFGYRVPLYAKKLFLDVNLDQNYNTTESKRSTYDLNDDVYDDFNLALSTDFNNYERNISPQIGMTYRDKKITASFGAGYRFQRQSNRDGLRPEFDIERDFELPDFAAQFMYRPTMQSMIRVGYNLSNRAPSLSQLRPFENTDDPLNTIVGNPNLTFTTNHGLSFNYSNYKMANKGSINLHGSVNIPKNNVIAKTIIDENFVRRTEYENVNGNQSYNVGMSYNRSIKIDTVQSVTVGLNVGSNFGQSVNFSNGIKYNANNVSLSPGVTLYYNIKEFLIVNSSYKFNLNRNKINLEDFEDREFFSHNLNMTTIVHVTNKLSFESDLNFNYNPEVAPGFQKASWAWNGSVSYRVLKDKGAISLKAFDILNQRTNARRIATENYIQDSESTMLQQYFMLGFRWNFNTLGTRTRMGPPPPPPGISVL